MKTTHQVSAGSHTPLGLFMERAVAARSPYSRVIAQMPGHALGAVHTINPQATHAAACLSSSEDRSDCGLARVAPEPRPSQ
jgi:hypothetical protein